MFTDIFLNHAGHVLLAWRFPRLFIRVFNATNHLHASAVCCLYPVILMNMQCSFVSLTGGEGTTSIFPLARPRLVNQNTKEHTFKNALFYTNKNLFFLLVNFQNLSKLSTQHNKFSFICTSLTYRAQQKYQVVHKVICKSTFGHACQA